MPMDNTVALVTGAGRGLGRAFAIALSERGFSVAATARSEAEISETAAGIMPQVATRSPSRRRDGPSSS